MNYYRPLISTFDEIANLLDQQERAEETQDLMISSGAVHRTDAGARFFNNRIKDLTNINRQLRQYPYEWIEAVKTVKALNYK